MRWRTCASVPLHHLAISGGKNRAVALTAEMKSSGRLQLGCPRVVCASVSIEWRCLRHKTRDEFLMCDGGFLRAITFS